MGKTDIPGKPTLCDNGLLTSPLKCSPCDSSCKDGLKTHPWRAPGTAPIDSPCGINLGADRDKGKKLKWQAGAIVEVAMTVHVNHGGGYAYRLCPAGTPPTETCFNKIHLPFVDDSTTVMFPDGSPNKTIHARRTTQRTFPKGSSWSRIPIPPCGGNNLTSRGIATLKMWCSSRRARFFHSQSVWSLLDGRF